MLRKKHNPFIDWRPIQGKTFLYFKFEGTLKVEEAEYGIERWDTCFEDAKHTSEKISLVWNCLQMKNYETEARIAWQNAVKKHRANIENIWLITDSVTITAGAEIISFFTSLKIRPIKSFEELESKLKLNQQ